MQCSVYRERAERFDREAAAQAGVVRLHGRLRLALFTASIAGAWWLFAAGRGTPAWLLLAASAALFIVFVERQRAARLRMRRAEFMADFNREGIARIARSWPEMRPAPDLAPPDDHDYADDLDLYGHASLLHLAGVCGTPPGWRTLQEWLLGGTDPDTVRLRQEAVREMSGALDFRDGLVAEGRLTATPDAKRLASRQAETQVTVVSSGAPEDPFLRWAEGEPWLPEHPWLRAAGFVLPPLNVAAIALCSPGDGAHFGAGLAPADLGSGARAALAGDPFGLRGGG